MHEWSVAAHVVAIDDVTDAAVHDEAVVVVGLVPAEHSCDAVKC